MTEHKQMLNSDDLCNLSNDTEEDSAERPSALRTNVIIPVVLVVIAVIVMIFFMVSSGPDRGQPNVIYDVELGEIVTLGQKKATIDKAIGSCESSYLGYEYHDSLHVTYVDGKATTLSLSGLESCWETGAGFNENTTMNEVREAYGEPFSEESDTLVYCFNAAGRSVTAGADYYVIYWFPLSGSERILNGVVISNEWE